jgi:transaldolase
MVLFLDTGNIKEIKEFHEMGLIQGVTTNPTILFREGVTGGLLGVKKCCIEIAEMIAPLPLSVELTTNDPDKMLEQALEFSKWAPNVVIKVPFHGPNGETENIKVIHALEKKHDIRVNVTAMMSSQQCLLAAMAGGTYVSLFCGRISDMGYDSLGEIEKLRNLLELQELPSQIIACSTRETYNVVDWMNSGAHIVTVQPDFVKKMIPNPRSKETVQQFMKDAEGMGIK